MSSVVTMTLLSVVGISLISLVGIALYFLQESLVRKLLLYIVSFSTGSLFGDVFYHMLPEMMQDSTDLSSVMTLILVGILLSFFIEKVIHWHHCHILPADDAYCEHHHVGVMSMIGDGVHNFIDGTLIAASFLVSTEIGIATTIAVALHEIPQEIGDFAILLHSGFRRSKAIIFNLLTGLTAVLGAVTVLLFSVSAPALAATLLPIAAGNFIYLAGSDLIPELHKHTGIRQGLLQLVAMILGMSTMYALTLME